MMLLRTLQIGPDCDNMPPTNASAMQDSVELAVALRKLLKSCATSFKDVPSELLEKALREYELIRAPRTHAMVALARYNVNLVCRKRTWLVWTGNLDHICKSSLTCVLHHHQQLFAWLCNMTLVLPSTLP